MAVLTLAALPAVLATRVDNRLELWIDRESPAWSAYQEYLDTFGSEEFILVVYPLPERFDREFLERLTDLRLDLEEIPGVRRVEDLAREYARGFSLRGMGTFRQDVARSPFYRGFLASEDRRLAGTWVGLERGVTGERQRLVEAVERAVARTPLGGPVWLAGSPVLDVELDRASRRASRRFLPLVFLLSGALLLVVFRRPFGVLVPFVPVGVGITWTLALLAASGRALNMVTITLPPVVWVLGLATAIHLLVACRRHLARGTALETAIPETLGELARPCLFSAVTTAVGFASLMASSMQPVREMGFFAAVGVLCCLMASYLLFPTLARAFLGPAGITAEGTPRIIRRGLAWLAAFDCRRRREILTVAGVLGVLAVGALLRLRVESNVLEFFEADAPVAVTYRRVLPRFTGPFSVEIALSPPGGPTLENLRRVEELERFVAAQPGVARAMSLVDLLKKAHQDLSGAPPERYELPGTPGELRDARRSVERALGEAAGSFLAEDGQRLRVTVVARAMESGKLLELVDRIEEYLGRRFEAAWRPRVTGIVGLLVDMQERLLTSQIRSFGLAFLVIVPVIGGLLRSWRHALLSLPPNLLPILLALGVMGLFGVPLDPATVMIAGIALGIAVDDTIHFFASFRRKRATRPVADAVREALVTVGPAMILTSVVAACGFLVLCLSDFVPLQDFGWLTAFTVGTALLGDLILLPALLVAVNGAE